MLANQIAEVGIAIFGIIVAVVAVLPPLAQIAIIVLNYLQKLVSGPIKTQPIANQDKPTNV